MTLFQAIRLLLPNSPKTKRVLDSLESHLTPNDYKIVRKLLKLGLYHVAYEPYQLTITKDDVYPQLHKRKQSNEFDSKVEEINAALKKISQKKVFERFAKEAPSIIPSLIAANIVGLDIVKQACAIQLFSKERFHILLLGDPGTGKTDIARSTSELHHTSTFGLGSGTSGVGLSATIVGKELTKGLLPMADGGICAIDELNLMAEKDTAGLYNAMEKGFITYAKKNHSQKIDARVRVIATANPVGDYFVGRDLEIIKKQIPFDTALLSRFHLVFLIRKPSLEKFISITQKIVENQKAPELKPQDKAFIADYIMFAEDKDVHFPKNLHEKLVDWAAKMKEKEHLYLIDVSPRIIIGIIRMAQAKARMSLRETVSDDDLKASCDLVEFALKTR